MKDGHLKRSSNLKRRYVIFVLLSIFVAFAWFAAVIASSAGIYMALKEATNSVVTIIITVFYVIVISIITTILLAVCRRYFSQKPLNDIVAATDSMAKGNYNVSLSPRHPWGSYDSYDVIMDNLNRMAQELSHGETKHTDFVANVSHEIKTPLAVIQSYAKALRFADETERENYCAVIEAASSRLTALVTNILKLNKLENQSIFPEKTQVDLAEQLRVCVLSFEERIEQKGLSLECDIDECTVCSDGGLLDIIWNNLLSNAVKFTDSGGISVSLKNDSGNACVCVRDTGCGISRECGARIFDKFYQGDTSHSQEGNGLGLALVKRVIDILGGEISVESRIGEGTAFTVRVKNGN
ncbi:MAG: HAMP domain-containing histidine kinase [Clostridia bacterium]|nr:HAMP domain-containing histidine kinase [Clostridia bacterium]